MQPINAFFTVSKFDSYNIQLKSMAIGKSEFEYHLDNEFFGMIGEEEIQKGDIKCKVTVDKTQKQSELNFELEGKVVVECDRCLEEMDQPVKTTGHLIVRFGKEFMDDGDDIVIVPEEQGCINISWFLYEFVTLAIPIKHVHPYGLCNKGMSKKLREHLAVDADDEDFIGNEDDFEDTSDQGPTDPRWDALKNLIQKD